MLLELVAGLLGVARHVFDIVTGSKRPALDNRDRTADYLAAVGATLAEIAAEIGAGRVPYGKCGELSIHAQRFAARMSDALGAPEAARLAKVLDECQNVERMAAELASAEQAREQVAAIAEASGLFTATALVVRAGG